MNNWYWGDLLYNKDDDNTNDRSTQINIENTEEFFNKTS